MSRPLYLTLVGAGMLFGVVLSRGALGTAGEPSSAAERSSQKRSEHLILKHRAVGRDSIRHDTSCQTWSCNGEHENDFEITVANEYVIDELMADKKNVFNVQLEEKHVGPAGRDLDLLGRLSGRRHSNMFEPPQEPWKTQSTYFVRSGLRLWLDLSWLPSLREQESRPGYRPPGRTPGLPRAVNNLPAVMDALSAVGFELVTSTSEVIQTEGWTKGGLTTYTFRR